MTDHATKRTIINAAPQQCYEVTVDFDRYPEWAKDVKEAAVVDRDDSGAAVTVRYRAAAMGRSTTYTLAYDLGGAPTRVAWELLDGDIMRRLDGDYRFAAVDGDPDSTEVTYDLSVALVVPLPGFVKRRAEARIIRTALRDLKARVEGMAGG